MSVFSRYATILANILTRGEVTYNEKLPPNMLKVAFNKIMSNKSMKMVFCINSIGQEKDNIVLYAEILNKMSRNFPKVKTNIYTYTERADTETNTKKFMTRMKIAIRVANQYEEAYENLSEEEKATGKRVRFDNVYERLDEDKVKEKRYVADSYKGLSKHVENGGEWAYNYIFIIAEGKTNKELLEYGDALEKVCGVTESKVSELQTSIKEWVTNFSPLGSISKVDTLLGVNAILMSDEQVAGNMPFGEEGVAGSTDNFSGFVKSNYAPFHTSFSGTSAAQNNLITAKTGEGKTVLVINHMFWHLKKGHYLNIMDYKGNEFEALDDFVDTKTIDLGSENPRGVNLLVFVDDYKKFSEDELVYFARESISKLTGLIKTIANITEREGNIDDINGLIDDTLNILYSNCGRGVDIDNVGTYKETKDLTYHTLWEQMDKLKDSKIYTKEQLIMWRRVLSRTRQYFHRDGSKSHLMKDAVSISEIIDSPAVIYNFHKNTKEDTEFDKMDEIRMQFMTFLNNARTYYYNNRDKFTVDFFEELQRGGKSPYIAKTLNNTATGGRSTNKIGYFIINSLGLFDIERDDPIYKDIAGLKSSITTMMIGILDKSDRKILKEQFDVEGLERTLEKMAQQPKKYKRHFAVSYNNGEDYAKTLIDFNLTKDIVSHPLFVSRSGD